MRALASHRSPLGTLILALALLSSSESYAVTYVSNLAEANTVNFGISASAHASSFTTDGSAYTLNRVTLAIQSNSGSGFAQVKIRADSSGMPGAELEDLGSINPSSVGPSLLSLNSSGLALSPNTTYWITAGETGSESNQWEGTTSTAEVSLGSWTIGDQDFFSTDGGASWQPTSFGPPNESSRFSVHATIASPPLVPALSPLGIAMLCGLLGLASWRRLRG